VFAMKKKNTVRLLALMAGISVTVPAVTVNSVFISAMEAVVSDAAMIKCGYTDAILTGGVEQMSGGLYWVLKASVGMPHSGSGLC